MSRPTIITINLLIVLVIGVFLIWPKYQDLRTLRLEIREKGAELQYKEKHFSNLKEISEELKKYQEELSKIDSILSSDPSLPSLFDFLQKASSQNGLILKNLGSFSITTSKENPAIKEIRLDFTLSGSYFSFKNFLLTLEKSARLIEVESISFSSLGEKETSPSFNLKIKVHSY